MTTITEDYVSFEIAKLLKKKGFNERLLTFYITDEAKKEGYFQLMAFTDDKIDNNHSDHCYLAPTLQMAMKWLREVHGLFISIGNDDLDYNWQIFDIKNRTKDLDPICLTDSYAGHRKYEQAVESALKYCLENLI